MTKSFIKKSFLIILIFLMIFAVGCSKKIKYEASYIQVKYYQNRLEYTCEFNLSEDDTNYILTILNGDGWEISFTRSACDYYFILPDIELRYISDRGLFDDMSNDRHLIVTEEQRLCINSILDSAKEDSELKT